MSRVQRRSTIYFKPELQKALRVKAAWTQRSLSDLVNEAVRRALQEDQEDLAAFDERANEPTMTYEELLRDLKAHGKISAPLQDVRRQRFARHCEEGCGPDSKTL
jgi:plasmid stability protein